ncbi:MAG TPA: hypothetical protein P5084_01690 [Paludibacter sp.]|nr:hypothetical protein [Paludibacter sp.]
MMKTIIGALLISTTLLSCGGKSTNSGTSSSNNETADYNSIVVTYQNTVDMMGVKTTTNETIWSDEKNNRKATFTSTETNFMGQNTKEESLSIENGDWGYNINLNDKTGTKSNIKEMKSMATAMAAGLAMSGDLKDIKSLKDFVESNGGKMLPNETILGKECTVYELMGTKQWLYKGMVLKAMMGDKVMMNAVKVEENVKIPAEKFEVPAGITITEAPEMNE